jgi:16S rRNA (cytidine1402-2'-O)-methyltransferase
MVDCLGAARYAVIARELTKTYETLLEGSLAALLERLRGDADQQKGEFVVLVQGAQADPEQLDEAARHTLEVLLTQLPLKQAAALAAGITGVSKNRLYEFGLELKHRSS